MISATLYLWLKAFHIIAVVAWMVAQLYLPRLFVYHCGAVLGGELSETLKLMERRLLKVIMTPAMIATWVFALAMVVLAPDMLTQPWFYIKLLAVGVLMAMHGFCARTVKIFAADQNKRSARFYRIMNEVSTLALIVAVVAVVVLRVL